MMCVCASMKPGRSVASPRSIVRAPAGILTVARLAHRDDPVVRHHDHARAIGSRPRPVDHSGGAERDGPRAFRLLGPERIGGEKERQERGEHRFGGWS